jgi:hypothetical protein
MLNNTRQTNFPSQKLSMSAKTQDWKEACVDSIVGREGGLYTERDRMKTAYDLYNGIFKEEDLKYVTNPYKVDDSFPASLQNFNIIRPKINLLLGEETKRPKNIMVYQTNESAGEKQKAKMKEMLMEAIMADVQRSMSGEQVSKEEMDKKFEEEVAKITNYVGSNYTNPAEVVAHSSLEFLRASLRLDNETLKGFKDGLIAGKEIFYTGIHNGDPLLERVNPLEFSHDNDPELDNIEDGDWATRHMRMTPTAIYDRFNDIMTESDLNKVLDLVEGKGGTGKRPESDFSRIEFKTVSNPVSEDTENLQAAYIDVWHAVWRSFKKVGFLHTPNDIPEEGDSLDLVDETYKPTEGETIEWDWVTEIWEGYKIGNDIYVGIQPVSYQSASIDNPNSAKLPYIGSLYSDTNSTNRSLVDIMKPLAYMYIIIWYRLELALSRDKGKIINMDITQIPKSMNVDVNKWLHYLTALGVNFINPYEEGWDIPGREGGRPAAFNQIGAQDLTMTNVIANYIDLMNKIEEMLGELSGVSKQRQGQISSSELVGNVERSVVQSSHITEVLFWTHNDIKKRAYMSLLNVAKHAWKNSDKKSLYYVLDDMSRKFVDITPDFLYSDFGVFMSDSSKEAQNIEVLRTLLQPAMQNGASLLDAASVLTADNMNVIKRKLEEIDKKREQMVQQQQQNEAAIQQSITQAEQQRAAADLTLRQEELRIKEEDSIRKAEVQLELARISAGAQEEGVGNMEPTYDPEQMQIEMEKLNLQRDKMDKDYSLKSKQVEETIRKDKKAEEFKVQEIAIKRKVANRPAPRPAAKK